MKKVVVASKNPVKIEATKLGFELMFPGENFEWTGISVASGVSDQPMTSNDTLQGALTRVQNAQQEVSDADFWVGLEGGVEVVGDEMECFAWIVVQSKEKIGKGKTSVFYLPKEIVRLVKEGMELGAADDVVFARSNSKQANGAVGILTGDCITRTTYYKEAVILALIPFKNVSLY